MELTPHKRRFIKHYFSGQTAGMSIEDGLITYSDSNIPALNTHDKYTVFMLVPLQDGKMFPLECIVQNSTTTISVIITQFTMRSDDLRRYIKERTPHRFREEIDLLAQCPLEKLSEVFVFRRYKNLADNIIPENHIDSDALWGFGGKQTTAEFLQIYGADVIHKIFDEEREIPEELFEKIRFYQNEATTTIECDGITLEEITPDLMICHAYLAKIEELDCEEHTGLFTRGNKHVYIRYYYDNLSCAGPHWTIEMTAREDKTDLIESLQRDECTWNNIMRLIIWTYGGGDGDFAKLREFY